MNQSDSQHITVKVQGPQKKGGHRIYSLIGSDINGQFNTVKRFSDFDQLRKVLITKWPACYIPSLPEKKIIGNQDPVLLEFKKRAIYSFMSILKNLQILWYAQETQVFLHKIGDTEKDLQKLKECSVIQILERYRKYFSDFVNKQVSDDARDKIIKFSQQLKKLRDPLQLLDKKVEQVYVAHRKYNEKLMNLIETLLPDYERNCLQVYKNGSEFQQMVFSGQKRQKIAEYYEKFNKSSNSITQIVREIKRQKEQIQCFEDLLKVKQQYFNQRQKVINKIKDLQTQTTKIHGGKQSLISKIKNKTKDQQLKENETQIQKAQEEQKNLALLCNIITLNLAQNQIQKFKNLRVKAYYSLLKSFFKVQKQECELKRQFWTLILKQNVLEKEELDNFFDKSPPKESVTESPNKEMTEQQGHVIQQQKYEQEGIDKAKNQYEEQKFNEVEIQDVQQISNDEQNEEQKKQKQTNEITQQN